MALMGTCLARLGSRYSIIFDPHRKKIRYGALGLGRQTVSEMVVGLDDRRGNYCTLPFTGEGRGFEIVDQYQTMTALAFEAHSPKHGVKLIARLIAPFWPRDPRTSTVPAYILRFRLETLKKVRWTGCAPDLKRRGVLRFGLKVPGARVTGRRDRLRLDYNVSIGVRVTTREGDAEQEYSAATRRVPGRGKAGDLVVPLGGDWRVRDGRLEVAYDLDRTGTAEASLAMIGFCGDALFERFGRPMRLKYARLWSDADAVARFVVRNHRQLDRKSAAFDEVWRRSSFPLAAQDLAALSFQSYLMNTFWTAGAGRSEWFGVAEGSCYHLSTVDVAYNEAMLYFTCWPELLEMLFEEWSHHANDAAADRGRRRIISDDDRFGAGEAEFDFPGKILQHDMGNAWTANGMSYHHMMPVEENSNWLLMLYAHGRWWNREDLYARYNDLNRALVEYLLWTDATGNGFPDRGTANTIDDATPAVQYGRDNVYLGVKRLAALHAARRMFEAAGQPALARTCAAEVRRAGRTLNRGWLGDHWGVCLDRSAKGLIDCWTRRPLPYRTLPGWDAYSLYTTNGLLYLMMADDLPPGIDPERLRVDAQNAARESMTRYGCSHSSADRRNLWISMNVWRDCAAGYLGLDWLENCERYWAQQVFANGPGAEKVNCFAETSLTNNLVWYPRNTALFGLTLSVVRMVARRRSGKKDPALAPLRSGRWPLLPLADWKRGVVPFAEVTRTRGGRRTRVVRVRLL